MGASRKIYCIGEILIDFIAEQANGDLSAAQSFSKKAGGAPANVACAIARLEGKAVFVGCVGKDPFGSFLLQTLKDNNVDVSLAQHSDGLFTTLAFVSLAEDGERDFIFSRGADRELQYDPTLKKEFATNMLHFGGATAFLGGTLEKAYGRYYFDALTQEAFISFDPNFRGDLWKGNEAEFVKKSLVFVEKATLCKFSQEEAELLSGKQELDQCCDFLHQVGAKIIVITLGAKGTYVSLGQQRALVPSIKVVPKDTTGAGDAFIGCLLQQIAQLNQPFAVLEDFGLLQQMVGKANTAGAITTTQYGAIHALPTAAQLQEFS